MESLTREKIISIAKEENVRFIRLQFSDILGTIKNVEVPFSQIDKALDGQMMFDGSSIEGFTRIQESDMYLVPDLSTWTIFPWTTSRGDKVARLICDVYKIDQTPFEGRSEEHTSELQSRFDLVCRLLLEKKKTTKQTQ